MKVYVGRCEKYADSPGVIQQAFDELGGVASYVSRGDTVLLKPNLLKGAPPDKAVTTHPDFIISVIRILGDAGARVVVADSPGGPSSKKFLHRCYEKAQWTRIPEETDAKLSYDTSFSQVSLPDGRLLKSVPILTLCQEADVVINLPKLKTHGLTVYTGAVKNMYGMVPGLTKSAFHGQYRGLQRFSRMLLDVYDASSPDLSIMDAILGMEGKGPAGGEPLWMNMVLASRDAHALDLAACDAAGIDLSKVPTLKEVGFNLEDVQVVGDEPPELKIKYPPGSSPPWWFPESLVGVLANLYMKRPELHSEKCVSCGKCKIMCPEDAITMNKYPRISWWKCIRCYCCVEICPEDALEPR
ncbi:MAG: DUF362 domain-containing protein [Thermoplasmata archaeon]